MPAPSLTYEATITLLEDAETAIRNVLRSALPGLAVETRIVRQPRLGIVINVGEEAERYPDVHIAKLAGPLRLSDYGREVYEQTPNLLIRKLNGME